ncbi:anaphase promoting complex subunit 11 [Aspergillus clavatus NRRL 1]|uniref:Anaphase-promoting complex subunit 11 n=1 Tax=Aspergillus clavatus (strain ATCC 1007 / CBS 513.65 / DSM 816 / NCTC 3887 / NRRL 1 / QM 1276 / 107) TaxID=344612 RepID=A1CGA3_ASPCL|nr:RING finger domain protein [Aspergillus clavatus NRRL 1]EAW10983.1 RING finger domain protein [Aspergillus clavatus NRRL 1]
MKVTIKEWNAVATWRWDMPEDEVCGICRVQFDGTCPTCKFPGDDCSLLLGKCGHSFHMHCLMTWIQQESSKGLCPMCRQSKSHLPPISRSDANPMSQSLSGNRMRNEMKFLCYLFTFH